MPEGEIIIRVECECGHRATLTAETLGEDPARFMAFDRLRCTACGRKGRPEHVTRSWSSTAPHEPLKGSYTAKD